jgi:hypothetical protein
MVLTLVCTPRFRHMPERKFLGLLRAGERSWNIPNQNDHYSDHQGGNCPGKVTKAPSSGGQDHLVIGYWN